MKTTGRDIFDSALALMSENAASAQTADYEQRALPLINLLIAEVRTRASFLDEPQTTKKITALSEELFLDERAARCALPYGLAARLLLEEDPARAASFYEDYEKAIASLWKGKITPMRKVW